MYYMGLLFFFFLTHPQEKKIHRFCYRLGLPLPGYTGWVSASLPKISNLIMNHHLRKVSVSHENANHLSLPCDNLVDVSVRVRIFVCFHLKSSMASCGCFLYAWALNFIN